MTKPNVRRTTTTGFDPLRIGTNLAGDPPHAATIAFWGVLAAAGFLYVFTPILVHGRRNELRRPPKDPARRAVSGAWPPSRA